jgi:hypothetical protein
MNRIKDGRKGVPEFIGCSGRMTSIERDLGEN